MMVAMSILVVVMIPISFSFLSERQEFGIYYHRAVAMELVDGEMGDSARRPMARV